MKHEIYFEKLPPKKVEGYVEIEITQEDINRANLLKPYNPPSQCSPIAKQLHDLGIGDLTIGGDMGFQHEEITAYLQAWDRGEEIKPTKFLIDTKEGKPLSVAILNPPHENN